MIRLILIALVMFAFTGLGKFNEALAKGKITKRAERLEEIKIEGLKGFSVAEIELETGKFYRLRITSDGKDEYFFAATDFFNSVWFDQIVINDLEIKPTGIELWEESYTDSNTILLAKDTHNVKKQARAFDKFYQ